ncbi:MAG: glutamate decarboxylase [Acidimicrobiales bacterium]
MLSRKVSLAELGEDRSIVPTFASRGLTEPVPRYELPERSMPGDVAYLAIHHELALDGNPLLNMATFVTTWMDDHADRLMAETINKNAIDWDEYPQTVEVQDRCVNILSRLFHAEEHHDSVGTATVGSSEAIHLAGLAMKVRWRNAAAAAGRRPGTPNIVMSAGVQVVWEKFARYFDVEPRYVPMTDRRFVIGVDEAMALVDENTIGVVGILGTTYTGEYEPIAELDDALGSLCAERGLDVPIHVDAASGGFVAPFLQPDLRWDFRLGRVRSINVSGHKYGLVYPGIGWILWREQADLPEELVFKVDYLGGSHDTFGLNFSRGASQIVAQYYNFLRLGFDGFREIMNALAGTARWLRQRLAEMGPFTVVGDDDLPVVCVRLAGDEPFDVFELSDALRTRGWIVPAYRMAPDAEDVAVLRIVVREGLSRDMAGDLADDVERAVEHLRRRPHASLDGGAPAGSAVGRKATRARSGRAAPAQRGTGRKTRSPC